MVGIHREYLFIACGKKICKALAKRKLIKRLIIKKKAKAREF